MDPRHYDSDEYEQTAETIQHEVAASGSSTGWVMRAGEEIAAAKVEVRLRGRDIGYVVADAAWTKLPGGSTVFWPEIQPPLAPAETRRRIAALPDEERCCDGCPTYYVDDEVLKLVTCDACWHRVPTDEQVDEDDVAALPEAQVQLIAAIAAARPDIFGPLVRKLCVKCSEVLVDPQLADTEDERCETCADHRSSDHAEQGAAA